MWKDLAKVTHDLPSPQVSLYWQQMLETNGWAGVCEVRAACNFLQTNITIWPKSRASNDIYYTIERYHPTVPSNENITLLLSHSHYTLLADDFPRNPLLLWQIQSKLTEPKGAKMWQTKIKHQSQIKKKKWGKRPISHLLPVRKKQSNNKQMEKITILEHVMIKIPPFLANCDDIAYSATHNDLCNR